MSAGSLSALVIAKDEAENLPGCLDSLGFADETVVVVDRASTDDTEAIAKDRADVVTTRKFDDFASQRNAALELAACDWVLAVDADERVTPELAREIRAAIDSGAFAGYRVPIRSVVLGREFHGSGTQFDAPIRLFRRERGRWSGPVHEVAELDGPCGRLSHWLAHRTIPDIKTFLRKMDLYTTLEAAQRSASGTRFRTGRLLLRPPWTALRLYLGKQGYRDGLEGLMFCAMSGVSSAVCEWKLRELGKAQEGGRP